MSAGFNLDDYVDVPERLRQFIGRYPGGCLQSEVTFTETGVLCKAYAYRGDEDPRPGIGHAFEPIPGKSPYTKDSEVMNAETSAWGRAIVALGFETKKIASANEVRARKTAGEPGSASTAADADTDGQRAATASSPAENPAEAARKAQETSAQPDDLGKPSMVVVHFGKNKDRRLGDLTSNQLAWYAEQWRPDPAFENPVDRRLKMAAVALHAGADDPDFEVPF